MNLSFIFKIGFNSEDNLFRTETYTFSPHLERTLANAASCKKHMQCVILCSFFSFLSLFANSKCQKTFNFPLSFGIFKSIVSTVDPYVLLLICSTTNITFSVFDSELAKFVATLSAPPPDKSETTTIIFFFIITFLFLNVKMESHALYNRNQYSLFFE